MNFYIERESLIKTNHFLLESRYCNLLLYDTMEVTFQLIGCVKVFLLFLIVIKYIRIIQQYV